YWRTLAIFIVSRLATQQFYPDLLQPRHGEYSGQWRLLATTGPEATALEQFAAAMPPVCQSVDGIAPELVAAPRLVETFLHTTTDALIRLDVSIDEFFNRAHEKAAEPLAPAEVRWLSALLGRDPTVRGSADELGDFAEQTRGWIGRLDESRADDALRLAFELIEPADDDDPSAADLEAIIEEPAEATAADAQHADAHAAQAE